MLTDNLFLASVLYTRRLFVLAYRSVQTFVFVQETALITYIIKLTIFDNNCRPSSPIVRASSVPLSILVFITCPNPPRMETVVRASTLFFDLIIPLLRIDIFNEITRFVPLSLGAGAESRARDPRK